MIRVAVIAAVLLGAAALGGFWAAGGRINLRRRRPEPTNYVVPRGHQRGLDGRRR